MDLLIQMWRDSLALMRSKMAMREGFDSQQIFTSLGLILVGIVL